MTEPFLYLHRYPGGSQGHANPDIENGWHPGACWCEPEVEMFESPDFRHVRVVTHQGIPVAHYTHLQPRRIIE
jgi:hypothetical protein